MKIVTPCPTCKGEGKLKRDCCQEEDLRENSRLSMVNGVVDSVRFCQWCGRIHIESSRTDAGGSTEHFFKPATKEQTLDLFRRMEF